MRMLLTHHAVGASACGCLDVFYVCMCLCVASARAQSKEPHECGQPCALCPLWLACIAFVACLDAAFLASVLGPCPLFLAWMLCSLHFLALFLAWFLDWVPCLCQLPWSGCGQFAGRHELPLGRRSMLAGTLCTPRSSECC